MPFVSNGQPWRHWFRRRHHHHLRPVLVFGNGRFALELEPQERLEMAEALFVGQTDTLSIQFLDTSGQPMATPPTPDSPPTWTDTTAATETVAPAADGMSCGQTAVAPGTDTVNLTVTVAGVAYTAQLDVTVSAQPQVLGSVAIVSGPPQGV